MKIVVGLGNPGSKYVKTRHNIGFMAIDRFAKEHNVGLDKKSCNSITGESFIECEKVIFVKPLTFMNASGEAVRKIAKKFSCNLDNIFVVSDDINLPLGKIRIRKNGSSGGHNGLKSISAHLQSTYFPRLRIGVGNISAEDKKDFVLSRFSKEEKDIVEDALDKTSCAINIWITTDIDNCMNMFN